MTARHTVAAVAYDRLCTFEFGCTVELFALPRPELDVPWYDFAVCAAERGPIRATGGIAVQVSHSLRLLERADTIVIPGWRDADEAATGGAASEITAGLRSWRATVLDLLRCFRACGSRRAGWQTRDHALEVH